jgi:hypothetical protein
MITPAELELAEQAAAELAEGGRDAAPPASASARVATHFPPATVEPKDSAASPERVREQGPEHTSIARVAQRAAMHSELSSPRSLSGAQFLELQSELAALRRRIEHTLTRIATADDADAETFLNGCVRLGGECDALRNFILQAQMNVQINRL